MEASPRLAAVQSRVITPLPVLELGPHGIDGLGEFRRDRCILPLVGMTGTQQLFQEPVDLVAWQAVWGMGALNVPHLLTEHPALEVEPRDPELGQAELTLGVLQLAAQRC